MFPYLVLLFIATIPVVDARYSHDFGGRDNFPEISSKLDSLTASLAIIHVVDARNNHNFGGGDNFPEIISKLDSLTASLEKVGKELHTLNSAYSAMRTSQTRGTKLSGKDSQFETAPLISGMDSLLRSSANHPMTSRNHCEPSEAEVSSEDRGGETTSIKKIFCPTSNTFLAAVQYADSGHITGICCERKKSKKNNRN